MDSWPMSCEKAEDEDTEPVIEEGFEHPLPNFMEVMYHFGKAGVGLCSYEITCLYLGLKMLVNSHPLKSARFWGKVFGLAKNYYIVETEFIEGEDEEGEEEAEQIKETPRNELTNLIDEAGSNIEEPCVRLDHRASQRIMICCLFTGNLDAKVDSTPSFPGTETNYLRAKIARISAATHISPEGFYQFGEEEEEEALDEEEGERQNYVRNEEYEPLPMEKLADRSLQHWVHHVSYILPQGRVTWWNPNQSLLDEMSEDEQEEEEEGLTILSPSKPERGPPILTSIAADASLSDYPAWSARLSSAIIPEHAVAVVSSNIWPGAHAIAWDKAFENIYIGWGVKATAPGFQPYLPQNVMDEFQNHSEVAELTDPTPEEEAALRKARAGPEEQEEIGEEGQEESNEEEESV
ncbi:radial spokehead-like protein [Opisthorchis viverrini]|uniref:Radial spokehead-like protein n=1 Tax=Opisthorchis viverrini TaxID=6198 RepID=A0A1S8WZ17_OPIVI|nr:radial spokehead-like protein [Opisthorchis viverrini]